MIMQHKKLALAGTLALTLTSTASAAVLFSDNFDTTGGVNDDLGTRQSGTLATDTYAGTASIASNQLSVGADKSVFKNVDFEAALTTTAVDFSLSFDTARSGSSNSAAFLSTHPGGDERAISEFGMHINSGGKVILYGGAGASQVKTVIETSDIETALGLSSGAWDATTLHNYELVATATTATTGTYDLFIDGTEVFSDKAYHLGTGGSNGELNWEIRTFPGTTAVFDNLSVEIVPEPGSLALIGLGGLMVLRRRRG